MGKIFQIDVDELSLSLTILIVLALSQIIYAQYDASLDITTSDYTPLTTFCYPPDDVTKVYFKVQDQDKNISNSTIDTLSLLVFSTFDPEGEKIVISESANNTNIFPGWIEIELLADGHTINAQPPDGKLQIRKGDTLKVQYFDEMNGFGNPVLIRDSCLFAVITGEGWDSYFYLYKSPYFIHGTAMSHNINVEPGVIIKFFPDANLTLNGTFEISNIVGTIENPILFTSVKQNPALGDWISIVVISYSILNMENAIIEYSRNGLELTNPYAAPPIFTSVKNVLFENNIFGSVVQGTRPTPDEIIVFYDNCSFKNNRIGLLAAGIYDGIQEVYANSRLTNCIFSGNTFYGIKDSIATGTRIESCIFQNNGVSGIRISNSPFINTKINYSYLDDNNFYEVYNASTLNIDARFNYWGPYTTTEMNTGSNPKNITKIYDQFDEPTRGFVNYGSWKQSLDALRPTTASLISPLNNQVMYDNTVELIWSSPDGANYSFVEVAADSLFSNLIITDSLYLGSNLILTDLEFNQTYFWRIKVRSIFGLSDWSESRSFQLSSTIPLPSIYWRKLGGNGLPSQDIRCLDVNQEGHIFAGTETGIYRSTDEGENWDLVYPSNYVRSITINQGGHIYSSIAMDGIFRSTDNGSSWNSINDGLGTNPIVIKILNAANGDIFISKSNGTGSELYKSTNDGENWNFLWEFGNGSFIYEIIEETDYLLAGGMGTVGGIFRSSDYGNTWILINYNQQVRAMLKNLNGNIYACNKETGISISSDNGYTWNISNGSISYPTSIIRNTDGQIFVGSSGSGVNGLPLNGNIWFPLNDSLSNTQVLSMAMNNNEELFIGTTSGVFKSNIVTSINESPTYKDISYNLFQNYPNPFNPVTKLSYAIPQNSFVELKVFNLLGQEIATLVNQEKPAGFYTVDFNAADLPSGVYIYRLQAGSFITSRKMILIK